MPVKKLTLKQGTTHPRFHVEKTVLQLREFVRGAGDELFHDENELVAWLGRLSSQKVQLLLNLVEAGLEIPDLSLKLAQAAKEVVKIKIGILNL